MQYYYNINNQKTQEFRGEVMGIADVVLNLAQSKASTIAKVTGRSESQVKAALAQGQKMLPDILKNVNSAESGARVLDSMGIDKSVLDEAYNKYSPYISKIPGMSATRAKPLLDMIKGAMRGGSRSTQAPAQTNTATFDKSKYPRV